MIRLLDAPQSYTAAVTPPDPDRVTQLVHRLGHDDPAAGEELLPLIYDDLRAMANRLFAGQPKGHTLQPTALVHEAWLKLADSEAAFETRNHFMAVAARAMRQVLMDSARARRADKRGHGQNRITFVDQVATEHAGYDLVDVDDALRDLAKANERYAKIVELRWFGGLTVDEVAVLLDLTPRTVHLDWRSARAWLRQALEDREPQ